MHTMKLKTYWMEETEVTFKVGKYIDGSIAWQLYDANTGEPLMRATVCLVEKGHTPAKGNVFIKDYAENEGLLPALIDGGVVRVVGTIGADYVIFTECEILIDALKGEQL